MSNRIRQEYIKIRVTPQEKKLIQKKVVISQFGSFQRYGLTMLLQGGITHVDYKELKELQWEIKKIGNNINQLTKLANQFAEISSQDIQDMTNELRQLRELVDRKVEEEVRRETLIYAPAAVQLERRE